MILNSEVWDLRSDRLLRSVPALDGTQLSWTGSGDVAVASFRLPKEEPIGVTLRRTKHPLRAAFRTIDAADYSEISHVEVERSLVDSCWDHGGANEQRQLYTHSSHRYIHQLAVEIRLSLACVKRHFALIRMIYFTFHFLTT